MARQRRQPTDMDNETARRLEEAEILLRRLGDAGMLGNRKKRRPARRSNARVAILIDGDDITIVRPGRRGKGGRRRQGSGDDDGYGYRPDYGNSERSYPLGYAYGDSLHGYTDGYGYGSGYGYGRDDYADPFGYEYEYGYPGYDRGYGYSCVDSYGYSEHGYGYGYDHSYGEHGRRASRQRPDRSGTVTVTIEIKADGQILIERGRRAERRAQRKRRRLGL